MTATTDVFPSWFATVLDVDMVEKVRSSLLRVLGLLRGGQASMLGKRARFCSNSARSDSETAAMEAKWMALLQKGRHAARRLLPCAQPSSTPRTASWCPSFCRPSSSHVLVELRPWDAFSRHLRATPSLNTCVCHHQPYASSQKKTSLCAITQLYISSLELVLWLSPMLPCAVSHLCR
uniref:Uncharacterized protein n=1 Tax=Oryza glaberrima TaxID=4538 RepID=I1PDT8_ORYGL